MLAEANSVKSVHTTKYNIDTVVGYNFYIYIHLKMHILRICVYKEMYTHLPNSPRGSCLSSACAYSPMERWCWW